jgi:hypothetical protein
MNFWRRFLSGLSYSFAGFMALCLCYYLYHPLIVFILKGSKYYGFPKFFDYFFNLFPAPFYLFIVFICLACFRYSLRAFIGKED